MKNNLFILLLLTFSLTFSPAARADIIRGGVSVGGGSVMRPILIDCLTQSNKLSNSIKQNSGREVYPIDLYFELIIVSSAYLHLVHISEDKTYLTELNNKLSANLPELLTDNTLTACYNPKLIQTSELMDFDIARTNTALEGLILELKN